MEKLKLLLGFLIVRLPEPVVRLFYVGRHRVVAGRRMNSKAQAFSDLVDQIRDPEVMPTVDASRRQLAMMAARFEKRDFSQVDMQDIELPGADGPRRARIYMPKSVSSGDQPMPTLLFFHGGGWVQGTIETHDGMCASFASLAGIRVISYDYRLAPEHPFPAGLDDALVCYEALINGETALQVTPESLVLGGDSAGANLTASIMHDLCLVGHPTPRAQLLIYPGIDARLQSQSLQDLEHQALLPTARIRWFMQLYLPEGTDPLDPRVSPLFSETHAQQPEALIIAGGHDPLWDDAHAYADRLRAAAVPVKLLTYPGQIHAFLSLTKVIPQGKEAVEKTAIWLKQVLLGA